MPFVQYFLRSTNLDVVCNSTGPRDLNKDQGSPAVRVDLITTSAVFVVVGTFDVDASPDDLISGDYSSSLNVTFISEDSGGDAGVEGRWRLQAIDAACAVVANSPYGPTINSLGIWTASQALTWPVGANRLRLSIELRKIAVEHGGFAIGFETQDPNSWVRAETKAPPPVVPPFIIPGSKGRSRWPQGSIY